MPTACEYVVDRLVSRGINTFFVLTGGVRGVDERKK